MNGFNRKMIKILKKVRKRKTDMMSMAMKKKRKRVKKMK